MSDDSGWVTVRPGGRGHVGAGVEFAQAWLDRHPDVTWSAEDLVKRIGQVGQVRAAAEAIAAGRREPR